MSTGAAAAISLADEAISADFNWIESLEAAAAWDCAEIDPLVPLFDGLSAFWTFGLQTQTK